MITNDNVNSRSYDTPVIPEPSQMLEESQFINISQKHLLFPNSPFQIVKSWDAGDYEFPFDQQLLPMMFENCQSEQLSPKEEIRKPSKNLNLQFATPQKVQPYRRYQSERVERRTYNNEQQNQPMRSQKGLRNLSIKVKEIVFELKSTSYKDVAERLIQELSKEEGRLLDYDNSKDEQNIKRRVYDALNVMIASKVLRKEGKKVKSDICSELSGKIKLQDRDTQKEKLIRKQKLLKGKKKHLADLLQKWKAANSLIERNKNLKLFSQQFFYFPLLIFYADQKYPKFLKDKKTLKILMKNKIDILSDLDIAKQLFLETVDNDKIQEECLKLQ
ncbi:unnamed protein product [Paramecium sonneborni]|uniref:E2F/DP family winged-helix DNA-binding domain-containing protein n=1 Tax=Paramecium sonneborni TaxID=65129 RepID=A0A8S1PP46_9CILI|nr:unnamed protein product [Paramecium sonneborni]CAD8104774.1 unnamed protein product [Paramecium sonneborni]